MRSGYHDSIAHSAKKLQFYRVVGERVRALREREKLSQSRLADMIKLNGSTINNVEIGATCSLYVLALLAEAFDVTLDELVPIDATADIGAAAE